MKTNEAQHEPEKEQPKQKVVLSFLAQQYGLTVEDLMRRGYAKEDIIVEKPE